MSDIPLFSILMMSHQRLPLLLQALGSAQAQTYPNIEILIVDSGSLINQIPPHRLAPNTKMMTTGEHPDMKKTRIMPSWVQNNFIPKTKGDWIVCLNDDDLIFPNYVQTFAEHAPQGNDPAFMYCGELRVRANEHGEIKEVLDICHADRVRKNGEFICQVDYLQCAINRAMWHCLYLAFEGQPYTEDLKHDHYPDGMFMERASIFADIIPVPGLNCINRRTPTSYYCGA